MRGGRIPPNLNQVQAFNVNRPEAQEAIWQPLYDFQAYAAAGQTQLSFFSNPIGQGTTSHPGSTGPKTKADTNMTNAGLLPNPQRFYCIGIEVVFFPGNAVNGSGAITTSGLNWQDVWSVAKSGYLNFQIGSKDYVTDGPLGLFPQSSRLSGAAAMADATTAAAALHSQIDYAAFSGMPYEISPFWIPSNQNFSVTLNWPNAVALPSTVAGRIGVRLNGFLYRLSQ